MNVPAMPPGLNPTQIAMWNRYAQEYAQALQNNPGHAQWCLSQMQQIARMATQTARPMTNPGFMNWLRQNIQPALTFFGAGARYFRSGVFCLGRRVVAVGGVIFSPGVFKFIAAALLLCLAYHYFMSRERAIRDRARAYSSNLNFGLLAHLQHAHREVLAGEA